jgi:hypothetical protein
MNDGIKSEEDGWTPGVPRARTAPLQPGTSCGRPEDDMRAPADEEDPYPWPIEDTPSRRQRCDLRGANGDRPRGQAGGRRSAYGARLLGDHLRLAPATCYEILF